MDYANDPNVARQFEQKPLGSCRVFAKITENTPIIVNKKSKFVKKKKGVPSRTVLKRNLVTYCLDV